MVLPNTGIGSANEVVYAAGVSSALSTTFLYDPSVALSADPAVYEKMLRDPSVSGSYDHLQRSIVGQGLSYAPRDPKNPKHRRLSSVLEDLTQETEGLSQALYNMSRATFMGATWGVFDVERRFLTIGDDKPRWWTVIARVRDIDKRRFRLERASKAPSGWQWTFCRGPSFQYVPLAECRPVDQWFQHVPDTSERGLSWGYGQADDIYPPFFEKQQVLRHGLQGIERWGQGFLYASVKNLAATAKARGVSLNQALALTVAQMRIWRSENLAAVDEGTELKLLDMPATANAECRSWVEYLSGEIIKRILSALQPTGTSTGTGSYSSSKTEEGSTDNTVAYLRTPLEERWTLTYARFLVEHNQDNLRELGLDKIRASRLQLKGKEVRDLEQMLKVFDLCARLKMPVRRSEFYEAMQLTAPNDEDEEHGDSITFETPQAGAGQDSFGGDLDHDLERDPVGSGGSAVGERPARNGASRVA